MERYEGQGLTMGALWVCGDVFVEELESSKLDRLRLG